MRRSTLLRRLARGAALSIVLTALLAPAATTGSVGATTVVAASAPPDLPVTQGRRYDCAPSVH